MRLSGKGGVSILYFKNTAIPFLLFCAFLTVSACASRAPSPESSSTAPESSPSVPTLSSASVSSAPLSSAAPGSVPAADKPILSAYQKAVEAYGWFDLTTMPTEDGPFMQYDGGAYQKVNCGGIRTYAELKAYLRTLFADGIVDRLLKEAGNRYRDIDGALYAEPADRGADITKGKETDRIVRKSGTEAAVEATVELVDYNTGEVTGQEEYEFPCAFKDGNWVFQKFSLVR